MEIRDYYCNEWKNVNTLLELKLISLETAEKRCFKKMAKHFKKIFENSCFQISVKYRRKGNAPHLRLKLSAFFSTNSHYNADVFIQRETNDVLGSLDSSLINCAHVKAIRGPGFEDIFEMHKLLSWCREKSGNKGRFYTPHAVAYEGNFYLNPHYGY